MSPSWTSFLCLNTIADVENFQIGAACGYFSPSGIDSAPSVSFIWVETFKLSVYGPMVLPLMAIFIICACEAIGDITATCDVSRLEVEGELFESRIQGGVLADGLNGILAALCTITPMSTFAQNNGVIALTRCANRKAGENIPGDTNSPCVLFG
jgi:xanthine/uracil permease